MPKRQTRRGPSRFQSALTTATKALSIAKSVKSLINVEFKYTDNSWSVAGSGTGGNTIALCVPQQGDTDITRNGDSIRMKTLALNMEFTHNLAGAALQHAKVVVAKYHLPDGGGVPTVVEMYDSANALSMLNIEKSSNWSILMSKNILVSAQNPVRQFSHFQKLGKNGIVCKFDGNSGSSTGADVVKNLLFIMVFSGDATNPIITSMRSRVRYIDN